MKAKIRPSDYFKPVVCEKLLNMVGIMICVRTVILTHLKEYWAPHF